MITLGSREVIDEAALGEWLEENVAGFSGLRQLVTFQAGRSNPTFRVDAESGSCVLRCEAPDEPATSATPHRIEREHEVMAALAQTGIPVPRMLALCRAARSPIGRTFLVMEHVDGRVFWDPRLPDAADETERAAIFDAADETLAALHSLDVEALGLGGFGRPGNYFHRRFSRLSDEYRRSKVDAVEEMERLIEWLDRNMPASDGEACLIHGDYRFDNLVFARDEPKILALIDWERATLGHPLSDLAYYCMTLRLNHIGPLKGLGVIDRAAYGIPGEADIVARYCERRGIAEPENWTFALAFSFFLLAAKLQAAFKHYVDGDGRYVDGDGSDAARARAYGRNVSILARRALDMIEEDG